MRGSMSCLRAYVIHVRHAIGHNGKALEYIGDLYDIEASTRGMSTIERRRIRREKTRSLVQIDEAWLVAKRETPSSKSDTAKAIVYTLNEWSAPTLYC